MPGVADRKRNWGRATHNKNVCHCFHGRVATHECAQENAIGAKREECLWRSATLQSDLVANCLSYLFVSLRSDSLGNADRTQTTRLGAKDATWFSSIVAVVQNQLWNLKINDIKMNLFCFFILHFRLSFVQKRTWVVFPDPVSPEITMMRLLLMQRVMSSRIFQTGSERQKASSSLGAFAGGTCARPLLRRPVEPRIKSLENTTKTCET